jgi:PD-(D/E)XK nuclease superfamily protein
MHEKKIKGDLAVAKTIARLTELGFNVAIPISEHASYDLLTERNKQLYSVQVKYSTFKNGCIRADLVSSWADKNGTHSKVREIGSYDILAIFSPHTDKVYFLYEGQLGSNTSSVYLRVENIENAQKYSSRDIKIASEFEKI